ncbi:3-keto-disaccharide hydrolase [Mucilaginibacter gotjawali]|uniref:Uncharacterized protein n=2 Tax=Mucilaginibacter gotjawali TaxID=1550579 RepID=A0A839SLZ2_9SPHI|nr:DUF1080 domain-containing protein [Mucilaginibacter gotjawali]MBB3057850.1 hypothetical protein [Mucilaginibacter gotjawali]BAU52378.1 hypothetical protein MgSA37_00534 [Mucilaginibacter gotjawali]
MKKIKYCCFIACLLLSCSATKQHAKGWISLFDGKSLNNWKVGDNAETFSVDSGMIIVHGKTAHLFYDGPVLNHNFKNFEFKADVMTHKGSNSGIYIHTGYQQGGWPSKGYEVQVNNSHTDWIRTGSLYGIDNIKEVYVKDNEWFTMYITVEGKRVLVKLNDKVVLDYTEPDNVKREKGDEERVLSSGTFALQGHDPKSLTFFKNIMVKPLR